MDWAGRGLEGCAAHRSGARCEDAAGQTTQATTCVAPVTGRWTEEANSGRRGPFQTLIRSMGPIWGLSGGRLEGLDGEALTAGYGDAISAIGE